MKQIEMVPMEINFIINPNATQTKIGKTAQEQAQVTIEAQKEEDRLKNKLRKILVGLILSLSAVIYGYSLKEITSVPIKTIMSMYSVTLDKFTTQSILIGILPVGSLIGAIITHFMLQKTERLTGMYIFAIVNAIAVVLINITDFGSLVAGRFLQGACVGYYTLLAPIYLREIAPKELRRLLGLFFSFGKIIGVLIAVAMELIYNIAPSAVFFRIILSLTALFSFLQAILVYVFCSKTPTEMIERGKADQARKIIEKFYKEQYVNEVFAEYQKQHDIQHGNDNLSENIHDRKSRKQSYQQFQLEVGKAKQNENTKQFEQTLEDLDEKLPQKELSSEIYQKKKMQSQVMKTLQVKQSKKENLQGQAIQEAKPQMTFEEKKSSAYTVGVHLCIIRHWTGANALISQGGLFVTTFSPDIGRYTSLIINLFQGIFIVIGLIWIQKLVGKRPLFLFSITLLSFINIALVIAMIYKDVLVIVFLMCVYMIVYGGSFSSPIWAYPSEVIPARKSLLSNIIHWLALALSTLIPPIVGGMMPDTNPYPVFLFFGLYGFFSFIHIFKYLRQSDGKSYAEIINSYK